MWLYVDFLMSVVSVDVTLVCSVRDPVCRWWASVLKAAVHWLQGDDASVRSLLSEAERMPRALHTLE